MEFIDAKIWISKYASLCRVFANRVTYDDILDTIQITGKKLLHFKFSKSGQTLHVDKTFFPGPVTNIDYVN